MTHALCKNNSVRTLKPDVTVVKTLSMTLSTQLLWVMHKSSNYFMSHCEMMKRSKHADRRGMQMLLVNQMLCLWKHWNWLRCVNLWSSWLTELSLADRCEIIVECGYKDSNCMCWVMILSISCDKRKTSAWGLLAFKNTSESGESWTILVPKQVFRTMPILKLLFLLWREF